VAGDAMKLGERHWRNAAWNRDRWQKLLRKALAQSGLLCQWWWWWLLYNTFILSIFIHIRKLNNHNCFNHI
jgi:hypothetical protein